MSDFIRSFALRGDILILSSEKGRNYSFVGTMMEVFTEWATSNLDLEGWLILSRWKDLGRESGDHNVCLALKRTDSGYGICLYVETWLFLLL